MENLKVKEAIICNQKIDSDNYRKFKKIANQKRINVKHVQAGDKIKIDNELSFDILWPKSDKMINENPLNNNSIVCKMNYKKFTMLFTGDIEKLAEEQILQEYKNNLSILKSKALKVAHHGSKTSTTEEFLKTVNPQLAFIGVGENNKFGHPNNEVLNRMLALGIKIYRTDKMGEIAITISKNSYNIRTTIK